jgi:hypothetical protein
MTIWSRVLVAVCALGAAAVAVSAQSGTNGSYHPPRTPWGDPDLQGNYTNLSEAGTPLERPKEYEGIRMADISPQERARLKRELAERTIGRFLGPTEAPDNWWQPAYGKFVENGAQLWLVVDPADGRIPALTSAARARQAAREEARRRNTRGPADSWTDRSLYDRCITRGFPQSGMPTIYGNSSQIVQSPGYVAIVYEMIHDTRIIPLDGRPHLPSSSRTDFGDSRGRWEGDTLVVETKNFNERSVYMNASPDTLTVTERFTRVSPTQVRWSVTLNDPATWSAPWTFSLPLTMDATEPLQLYECHEGNYGLKNILSAARAEERNAAAGSSK